MRVYSSVQVLSTHCLGSVVYSSYIDGLRLCLLSACAILTSVNGSQAWREEKGFRSLVSASSQGLNSVVPLFVKCRSMQRMAVEIVYWRRIAG